LRGLLVDFGHVRVVLPAPLFPRSAADLDDGLSQVLSRIGTEVTDVDIGWPGEPGYLLD